MSNTKAWLGVGAALALVVTAETDAAACGGCFAPVDNPTVVTDHRMVMTITRTDSTLYDQIRYQGDPKSFAWVLPYAGEIEVGVSSDIVFTALDQLTQTQILPPPGCGGGFSSSGGNGGPTSGSSAGGDSDSVVVIKREVVGPYDTVQLKADDPAALDNWLKQNGYNIPADVAPVIATYVNEHFNFLALKLVPNKGIQDMRPVRVTTKAANTTLPLRMVAAGTGATVGISLWVVSEGRYEPQNFGSFIIDDNDLGWDPNSQRSNYTDVRTRLNAKGNGAVWEVESSIFLNTQFEAIVRQGSEYDPDPEKAAAADYTPIKDAAGNVMKSARQVREDDLKLLVPNGAATRVTRMRADLARAALAYDLTLRAAADQSVLSNVHQLARCGFPDDPNSSVIKDGQPTPPSSNPPPVSNGNSSDGTFTCASRNGSASWSTVVISFAALALVRGLRRRR